jgi:PAS domain S-box-containing protein
MSDVHILGDLPAAAAAALEAVGVACGPRGAVALGTWPPDHGPGDVEDRLFVALVDDPAHAAEAIEAGAIAALQRPVDPSAVRAVLMPLIRAGAASQARLRSERRKARRAMAELQSTRDLLGRLIDATPNPVMASDMQGRVLVFNRAAEAALGYESRWARDHMHVTEIYADPSIARRVLAGIRGSPSGMMQAVEVRLRARSGEQIPVLLSAAEVYAADGMPIATVGVFEDQRQEVALRNRLEETTEQLIESEKRAAAIEVAGAAAHELNQPLTTVMGALEMLEMRADLPEDVHRRVERAYVQLERMAEIVRRLGDTTRPRSKRYVGQARILDLNATVE